MAGLREIGRYINHRINSKSWRSFHSPYLFSLFRYIFDDSIKLPAFQRIEEKRRSLLSSSAQTHPKDFGAGSKVNKGNTSVAVSDIARSALSLPFQCRFMSRLAIASS